MSEHVPDLSVGEIAALARVSRRTVAYWCSSGVLVAYRFGARGSWRVRREDWEAFLRNNNRADNGSGQASAHVV